MSVVAIDVGGATPIRGGGGGGGGWLGAGRQAHRLNYIIGSACARRGSKGSRGGGGEGGHGDGVVREYPLPLHGSSWFFIQLVSIDGRTSWDVLFL